LNFDATVYAWRNVAAAVRENRLKQLRSVATHYKKQAASYRAVLVVATRTVLVTS
jgi:hypothetical protein